MNDSEIIDINFNKINRVGSNVGFVDFVYNGFAFKRVAVHQRLDKTGYRLVYSDKEGRSAAHPINKETQQHVEKEVISFLKAQDLLK